MKKATVFIVKMEVPITELLIYYPHQGVENDGIFII